MPHTPEVLSCADLSWSWAPELLAAFLVREPRPEVGAGVGRQVPLRSELLKLLATGIRGDGQKHHDLAMGVPKSWIVYRAKSHRSKWMMTGGAHILGNLQIHPTSIDFIQVLGLHLSLANQLVRGFTSDPS